MTVSATPYLDAAELRGLDAHWRAANYLSVGQIYLLANPLPRQPLALDHIKPRLLGHWGTTPGLNLIYAHLNRAIGHRQLQMLYVTGPGHGGPGLVANTWLEGSYTERYPWCSAAPATCRRSKRSPPRRSCANGCPTSPCAWSTWWT
jgi:xylulose-5-phosphate/fructose-6-phosphate phosphoketolase